MDQSAILAHGVGASTPLGAVTTGENLVLFPGVKIRPQKADNYPSLRTFGWVSYDKVGVLYSGKLGNSSEARASDLRSHPGLWWN